jgi:hypothetical protein
LLHNSFQGQHVDNSIHSLPFQQIQGTNLSLTCLCRNTWRGVQKLLDNRTKRGILPFPKLLDSSTISTSSSSCTWAAAPFLLHTNNQAAGQHGQHFPQAWTTPAGQHGQQLYTPLQQQIMSNNTPLAPNPNLLDSTCSTCSCWTALGQQQHSAAPDSMDNSSPQGLDSNNTLQHLTAWTAALPKA